MKTKFSVISSVISVALLLTGLYLFCAFWGSFYYFGYAIYGLAFLVIGIVLLLFTKMNWIRKTLLASLPILIVSSVYYNSFAPAEIYLIPEGYKGYVYVVFDQKNGAKESYERKKRIYKIPETGILFTKFKAPDRGLISQSHFYVTADGMRKKLQTLDFRVCNDKEPFKNQVAIFHVSGIGELCQTMSLNTPALNRAPSKYQSLFVGTCKDLSTFEQGFSCEYIDSLLNLKGHSIK